MKPGFLRRSILFFFRIRVLIVSLLVVPLQIWAPAIRAELLAPAPDSAIWQPSATFTWRREHPDSAVWFTIGTELDSGDILSNSYLSSETDSITVHDLPMDRPIYLSVRTQLEKVDDQGKSETQVISYRYQFNTHVSIDDRDLDGIIDEIDLEPGKFNGPETFIGEGYVLSVLDSGRVVNLQSSGIYQQASEKFGYNEGNFQRQQVRDITEIIYQHLDDSFDFIVLTNLEKNNAVDGYAGIYVGVQNSIQGIGSPHYNYTTEFGSHGKLQGVIHLPNSVNMNAGPGLHELMHRWGSDIDILGDTGSHWGASDVGGQLGGWKPGSLNSLGNNQYSALHPVPDNKFMLSWGTNANGGNVIPLSDLELYLMGLISKDDINRDFVKANGFQWVERSKGVFQASHFTTVSVNDIVAEYGERFPNYQNSQKQFDILYVVLSDRSLNVTEWKHIDQSVYQFSHQGSSEPLDLYNFWEATGGRGSVVMDGAIAAIKDNSSSENVLVPLASIDGAISDAHLTCPQVNLAYSMSVVADQPADLTCSVHVAKDHVGKMGSTYIVAELVGQALYVMDSSGGYHEWDGALETLMPSSVGVLEPIQELTAFKDLAFNSLGINSGALKLYFGYAHDTIESLTFTSNGILVLVEPEM